MKLRHPLHWTEAVAVQFRPTRELSGLVVHVSDGRRSVTFYRRSDGKPLTCSSHEEALYVAETFNLLRAW